MNSVDNFKVLTLDGGGVRGYLSAKLLANIEKLLNKKRNEDIPLGKRFDLIVGTSTGGIIASALAIGKTAQEIFELYETMIPEVFIPISNGVFESKYSNEVLKIKLLEILEDKTLADIKIPRLCITSVDVENSSPRFHKSDYFDRNDTRLDETLVDVALATSAAPTYFPLVDMKHSTNLTDGGIVANNPSMVGLIDAILINGNKENISLISIGTGEQCHMPYNVNKLKNGGKKSWMLQGKPSGIFSNPLKHMGSPLLELLMDSQSKLAHHQTKFLLEDKNYMRINPKLSVPIELDSVDKLDSLKNLADISQQDLEQIDKLL